MQTKANKRWIGANVSCSRLYLACNNSSSQRSPPVSLEHQASKLSVCNKVAIPQGTHPSLVLSKCENLVCTGNCSPRLVWYLHRYRATRVIIYSYRRRGSCTGVALVGARISCDAIQPSYEAVIHFLLSNEVNNSRVEKRKHFKKVSTRKQG